MIVLKKITKQYNKKVIHNFSYVFEKGKSYAIIGPSGCGKSTLLNIIAGIDRKYKGNVYFNERNIKKMKNYTFHHVGFVFQQYQLFNNLTALENVLLSLEMINYNTNIIKSKVLYLFKVFQVTHCLNEKVKNLSGGEKQRIAIIKALIKNSDILLLDEPTSALDPSTTKIFFDYIDTIKKNKVIIMVTHNNDLANLCDEIINYQNVKSIDSYSFCEKKVVEEKIKFHKIRFLYKKIFVNKKIFNYICNMVLTLGLVAFVISQLLSIFINDVIRDSFSLFNTSSYITFKEISEDNFVDFNKYKKKYDAIYYQGINANLKQELKKQNLIEGIYLGDLLIHDFNFIYDNYLTTSTKYLTLYINEKYKKNENLNAINVTIKNYFFDIYFDEIIYTKDEGVTIYCNDPFYLLKLFSYIKIPIQTESYFYSLQSKKMYENLLYESDFSNYNFYLDEENDVIKIEKIDLTRVSNKSIETIKTAYDAKVITSDFQHTYIDYDTGFIYLLLPKNEALQLIIDESVKDNCIAISKKLSEKLSNTNKYDYYDKSLVIEKITKEENYEIVYMNSVTFESINDDKRYSGIIFSTSKKKLDSNLIINNELFNINSFEVFEYVINFLQVFSIILLFQALITSLFVFTINFTNKKKDITCIKRIGVYDSIIYKLLLYDPLQNTISSVFSSLFTYIFASFAITFVYNAIKKSELQVHLSMMVIAVIILVPIFLILPLIIFKIYRFLKNS